MITRCTSRTLAMLAGIILMAAAVCSVGAAQANAQCNALTIVNNTHCTVTVWVVCSNGTLIGPISVAPGSVVSVGIPAGCNPFRVVTLVCGNRTTIPNGGCINNAAISNTCCANVCFNPLNCTVTFTQVPGPCPCP